MISLMTWKVRVSQDSKKNKKGSRSRLCFAGSFLLWLNAIEVGDDGDIWMS